MRVGEYMTSKLKIERVKSGLTQGQVADKAFISRATLSRMESGKTEPTPDLITRLAQIYGISEDELTDKQDAAQQEKVNFHNQNKEIKSVVDNSKLFYMIMLFASVVTVPYGVFFCGIALYYAVKKKFHVVMIILNVVMLLVLLNVFLIVVCDFYIIPPKITIS
jgi:transcriptional regulator with XRE-family HTH domain